MNWKLHTLVVIGIIATLFFVWQLVIMKPEPVEQKIVSAYKINISRATYGAACAGVTSTLVMESEDDSPYQSLDVQDFKENNAYEAVKKLCQDKSACKFIASPETMGFDPFPNCALKDLQIEFRCFQVDRLRKVSAGNNAELVINCDEIVKK